MFGINTYIAGGLGVALLIASGFGYLQMKRVEAAKAEIAVLELDRDEAARIAQANADAAEAARTQARLNEKALDALAQARGQRQARVQKVIQEVYRDRIIETPAGCPAASPVLLDGLERLRRLKAGTPDPADPGAARPGSRSLAALPAGSGNP